MTPEQWISKEEAGIRLGSQERPLSTRRVLELAKTGRLQSDQARDPDTGHMAVRIHAGSVERFIFERDNPSNEGVKREVQSRGPHHPHIPHDLVELIMRTMRPAPSARLFLTLESAADYSGLGAGFLRKQISDGKLQLLKGAGIRGSDVVRRADLEKL